jgi:hypothetical protein
MVLFVTIGQAQMKDMNHQHQTDSTHQMKMGQHESMMMKDKMDKTMDEKNKGENEIVYYTCPMKSHKQIHSSEPGKCSKCPMKLVKVVLTNEKEADFYGCPMPSHSHVRSDKPGKCDECGMMLQPMKLKKS